LYYTDEPEFEGNKLPVLVIQQGNETEFIQIDLHHEFHHEIPPDGGLLISFVFIICFCLMACLTIRSCFKKKSKSTNQNVTTELTSIIWTDSKID